MITRGDDLSAAEQDGSDHGVGTGSARSFESQTQGKAHMSLVEIICHSSQPILLSLLLPLPSRPRREPLAFLEELFQLHHELVDVLERAIDRSKSTLANRSEFGKPPQAPLPNKTAGNSL